MKNYRATLQKQRPWPWDDEVAAHCAWCARLLLPVHKPTGPEHCPAHAHIPLDAEYIPMIQSGQREEADHD